MLRAVFFDATHTLIHAPKGVAHHYWLVAQRHGLNIDEAALRIAFRAAWFAAPARPAQLGARSDDDKNWWKQLVTDVLQRCDFTPENDDLFSRYFEELYAHFKEPGVWELYPDVKPTLAALREKYALGVISNFDQRLRVILDHLGVGSLFQTIVLSSEAGADKPHPQIFQCALARVGAKPDEALHVGDDPIHDWQGAKQVGMHVFHLDRKQNSLLDVPQFAAAL